MKAIFIIFIFFEFIFLQCPQDNQTAFSQNKFIYCFPENGSEGQELSFDILPNQADIEPMDQYTYLWNFGHNSS